MRSALVFFVSSFFMASFAKSAPVEINVIYGEDGRHEVYESKDPRIAALADSTAAMFEQSALKEDSQGRYEYDKTSVGQSYSLCAGEPYRNQPAAALCSGFLVGEDLIATAGHCVPTLRDCEKHAWVFGYRMKNASDVPENFDSENIYRCKELIKSAQTGRQDFALIRLDRPVRHARPLVVRDGGNAKVGDKVFVVGHPMGIPTKIADGAQVRKWDSSKSFFIANLDTYGGNSGSAVFNARTLEVEGILVRGEQDLTPSGGCYKSNVCENMSCRGEDVTNIKFIRQLLEP